MVLLIILQIKVFWNLEKPYLARVADENKIDADPESIIVTVGASEALHISLQALINKGDEVLIPDPGFLSYDPCVKLAEGKMCPWVFKKKTNFE